MLLANKPENAMPDVTTCLLTMILNVMSYATC